MAPDRCSLGGGSVWDVVVQPSPGALALTGIISVYISQEGERPSVNFDWYNFCLHHSQEGERDLVLTLTGIISVYTTVRRERQT